MTSEDEEDKPPINTGVPRIWQVCQGCPNFIRHDKKLLFKCDLRRQWVWLDQKAWLCYCVPFECTRIMESLVYGQEEDGKNTNTDDDIDKTGEGC